MPIRFFFHALRRWLEQNKVFFEVLVAATLSFMAVYVSYKANSLTEAQNKIMQQENLPRIEGLLQYEFNDTTKIYEHSLIYVFNRGGKLSEFKFESFANLNVCKNHQVRDTIRFPLEVYYDSSGGILSGEVEGLVFQIGTEYFGAKEIELQTRLRPVTSYTEIEGYAKISYKDFSDELHTEYFRLSPRLDKISKTTWVREQAMYASASKKYNFNTLKDADIAKVLGQSK